MAYAFTYDVPINEEIYRRIMDGVGAERPPGLIAHIACKTDGGLRYTDVWQTKGDFEAFEHDRLHPVIHPILKEMLGFVPPEPPRTMLDLVDAWTAEHTMT